MSLSKKTLLAVALGFIVIQFIQPTRNNNDRILTTDISKIVSIPDSVQAILKNACYDCHSNNTAYPWYSNIQPTSWLMAKHIRKAKEMLNFSEFGNYSLRRRISKLDGISNSIKDNIMPISSYKLMHKNAQLSPNQMMLIINWALDSKDSLSGIK